MSGQKFGRELQMAILCATLAAGSARAAEAGDGPPPMNAAVERELATAPRLATILRVIGERNPDLREADERARASELRTGAAARRPDPELKGEAWGVPLARPAAFDQANTLMLGLRQSFPAWGSLAARERASREDALAAGDGAEAARQEAAVRARRAFAAYVRADREYRLHVEHAGLASRVVDIARSLYQVGHGAQQDLLRAQAELSRLHVDVVGIEQQRRSAQALLNTLMDREPDAALGPAPDAPAASAAPPEPGPVDAAERLGQRRPDLRAAARAVKRSEALVDVARREATLPALMVGADYWYMPTFPSHHAYGAMVSVSLPWLNAGRPVEVAAAERASVAERNALRSRLVAARFELKDAELKLQAARDTLALLRAGVLADAKRNFEATQAQFQSGRGDVTPVLDAARSYLEARIDEIRALADVESSQADYARAAGLPVVEMAAGPEAGR